MTVIALKSGGGYDVHEQVHDWGDDPFEPPEAGTLAMRRRAWDRPTVSVPLAAMHRAMDAGLSGPQSRVLLAALCRVDTFDVAEFGRGELARLAGVRSNNLSRELATLKGAGVIGEESSTTRVLLTSTLSA